MDRDSFLGLNSFCQQILQYSAANANPSMIGQNGYVYDADFLFPAIYIKPTDRVSISQDNVKGGSRIMLLVVLMLSVKLRTQEGFFLSLRPGNWCQFLLTRTGIDSEKKFLIFKSNRSQTNVQFAKTRRIVA